MGITIFTDKETYYAGGQIAAVIKLDLDTPIKARGIFATLVCSEKHKKKYVRNMPQAEIEERRALGLYTPSPYVVEEERVEEHQRFRQEKKIAGDGTYLRGEFQVHFTLPADAAPTSYEYGHDNKIVEWKLQVKLDIPFAIDINASKDIEVGGL